MLVWLQADLNGDGHLEVIIATHDYTLQVCMCAAAHVCGRRPSGCNAAASGVDLHPRAHTISKDIHRLVIQQQDHPAVSAAVPATVPAAAAATALYRGRQRPVHTAAACQLDPMPQGHMTAQAPSQVKARMSANQAPHCITLRHALNHLSQHPGVCACCPVLPMQLVRPEAAGRAGEGFAPVQVVRSFSLIPQKVMLGRDRRPVSEHAMLCSAAIAAAPFSTLPQLGLCPYIVRKQRT